MERAVKSVNAFWSALVIIFLSAAPVQADWILGSCTATQSTDPGFTGYWKYTLSLNWNLGQCHRAPSHFTMQLLLDDCPCVCDAGYVAFADTVGSGTGDECTFYSYGEFNCDGDPSIPGTSGPVVKFEFHSGCEPVTIGQALLSFYCLGPPTPPQTFEDAIAVKAGSCRLFGDIEGVLPTCDCDQTPTHPSSWGSLKSLYRR